MYSDRVGKAPPPPSISKSPGSQGRRLLVYTVYVLLLGRLKAVWFTLQFEIAFYTTFYRNHKLHRKSIGYVKHK